ncbi:Nickel-cobalt-cadmium resistance protein NccA [Saliniradius amylolyticus]|uniref:Nickel-cobalt-cadmium resistance protein NccA n=1 Tax=Saliniradius amylolyticus TaxID=2183582 RepID=A0A2S2E3J2_9ALTE|nr:efflux RND transporter permease subunit [Saliniradius amylolyticus]AWL11587.1 Nickel-cobalt-cadmium resistance protein NccA [Saliniradius amylolyticus]
MNSVIQAAFQRSRAVVLLFFVTILAGAGAYYTIPKEAEPDITIPTIYVSMVHHGISPEDAERLLIRPMEKELQSVEGLNELRAVASEGYASITLEFDAGFNPDQALRDVREQVDIAKAELPPDTEEPRVTEVNVALFPVITAVLSGPVPERQMLEVARRLQERIETIEGVLEVEIAGDREELLEILVEPNTLETYGLSFEEIISVFQRNNRLVAAGALESEAGRILLKVPGVIETLEDVLNMPVKTVDGTVITFGDVATIRRTFKDPDSFARVGGQPSIALEITKRAGANIIETIEQARQTISQTQDAWPASLKLTYMQDKSEQIRTMLGDLQNNVLTAIVLVMIVVLAAMGPRPAMLVGLAIPGAFLAGILVIQWMGLTLNIVVLFSLILVVGMLVDGAIVTTELADRYMSDGQKPKPAYRAAAQRMAWPIIASIATTLAVFVPLLPWPGIAGEFMRFLPITVIITLIASLAMALIFIPVLGGVIGRAPRDQIGQQAVIAAESGKLEDIGGFTGRYLNLLSVLLQHPGKVLLGAILLLVGAYSAYGTFGRGVEFFPEVEPEFAQVQVRARGDLSIYERDKLVRQVEQQVLPMNGLETVYTRTMGGGRNSSGQLAEDVIGVIQLEFVDWQQRRSADEILGEVRQRTQHIPGIIVQVQKAQNGPSQGKPVQLQVRSSDSAALNNTIAKIRDKMRDIGGFVDVTDSRPLPGVEWQLRVDRDEAARYSTDVVSLGNMVQMITNGVKITEYRPDDADEEVEVRVRFPHQYRSFDQLDQLRVPTRYGPLPVTNFVNFEPAPKTGTINRADAQRVMTIEANVTDGVLVDEQIGRMEQAMAGMNFPSSVSMQFKGEAEDQQEAANFLMQAFATAVFLMLAILLIQFNSFYQAALVLSAIVFSTAGVLLGLLVTGRAFSIVMGGVGIIALAGIVVNNNIILIDTFNDLKHRGYEVKEAILRTCAQRLRPVLLTALTTVLGLLPMVFALNIDLINQDIAVGAPSTQWWTQLSSAIAGGLTFATLLTLLLTPCLLRLGERLPVPKTQQAPDASPGQA